MAKKKDSDLDKSPIPAELSTTQNRIDVKDILNMGPTDTHTFSYGDFVFGAHAFNQYLEANIYPGTTKTMTRKQIIGLIKQLAITLSTGGLNNLSMLCLGTECPRHAECPLVRMEEELPIGNSCQPPGELVRVRVIGEKRKDLKTLFHDIPIETLDPSKHRIISARKREGNFVKSGRDFTVHSRHYEGNMYTFSTKTGSYRCTADHFVMVKWREEALDPNLHMVYMMRKGDFFRVGVSRLFHIGRTGKTNNGLSFRLNAEKADCGWILGIYDNKNEALLAEEKFSLLGQVPEVLFMATPDRAKEPYNGLRSWISQERLDQHLKEVCRPVEHYSKFLESLGLSINSPFMERGYRAKGSQGGTTNAIRINACNVQQGLMDMRVVDDACSYAEWEPVEFSTEYYEGPVYSLDVDVEHNYITAGGILTFNCPIESTEILNHVRQLSTDFGEGRSYADQIMINGIAGLEILKTRVYADMSTNPEPIIEVEKGIDARGNVVKDKVENPNFKTLNALLKQEQTLLKGLHLTQEQRIKLEAGTARTSDVLITELKERLHELSRVSGAKLNLDAQEADFTPIEDEEEDVITEPKDSEIHSGPGASGGSGDDGEASDKIDARDLGESIGDIRREEKDHRSARRTGAGGSDKPYLGGSPFARGGGEGKDTKSGPDANSLEEAT